MESRDWWISKVSSIQTGFIHSICTNVIACGAQLDTSISGHVHDIGQLENVASSSIEKMMSVNNSMNCLFLGQKAFNKCTRNSSWWYFAFSAGYFLTILEKTTPKICGSFFRSTLHKVMLCRYQSYFNIQKEDKTNFHIIGEGGGLFGAWGKLKRCDYLWVLFLPLCHTQQSSFICPLLT